MLLISLAFGQTGTEPAAQTNNVQQWCLTNATLKDQLVRKGGCVWRNQSKAYSILGNGKRYVCKSYPLAKVPAGSSYIGYEGELSCPDPFGNLDKDGNILQIVYQCARCITSNTATGSPDEECMDSMKVFEEGLCMSDAAKMTYFHDIGELKQNPAGGPVPTPDMQNPIGTPPF